MVAQRPPFVLPKDVPVFPLPGVVLMPFGHLPLTIFEPRYINMVDDALGRDRTLALVQPRGVYTDFVDDDAPLYDVGTVGRIVHFQDSANSQYLITLEGLSRFRIKRHLSVQPSRGYRMVETDYSAFANDMHPTEQDDGPERQRILILMKHYFSGQDLEADWDAITDAPYEALVSSLVMSCPFSADEKQALLQCESHNQRANMLISLFEMSIASDSDDLAPVLH